MKELNYIYYICRIMKLLRFYFFKNEIHYEHHHCHNQSTENNLINNINFEQITRWIQIDLNFFGQQQLQLSSHQQLFFIQRRLHGANIKRNITKKTIFPRSLRPKLIHRDQSLRPPYSGLITSWNKVWVETKIYYVCVTHSTCVWSDQAI